MGYRKNVHRVINVPKIGGFLPIVPILTALSALGSLASGIAAIAKTINNARMAKEDMEEKKLHNMKILSGAVGEGLYIESVQAHYPANRDPSRAIQLHRSATAPLSPSLALPLCFQLPSVIIPLRFGARN